MKKLVFTIILIFICISGVSAVGKVSVSVVNQEDGSNLKGANLKITDEEGNTVKEWTSTDEDYIITDLDFGNYILEQVSAPKDFELSNKKIEFVIDITTDEIPIKIENKPVVKLEDSSKTVQVLLLCVGMFDIALGIGIVIYVKKAKNKE